MKSLKKTLVLLVVFSMILSAVMPAFAAIDVAGLDCEEEVARLEALGVVKGIDDEGHYAPEQTVTRAQMAVILCKMVGIDEVTVAESANVPSKFSDVAAGAWYTGYINVAAGKGLLSGFPDGTFRPDEQLTMNHVLTLCVNALGRGEYVAQMGTWPANYIAEATKLGLVDGVSANGGANRGNVAIIVWNTLEAPYVWDVTSTEYEGSINLSDSDRRTLLSIYFRDFATKATGELKEITEVEISEGNIKDRQLVLDAAVVEFANEFDKEPSRNKTEKSYKLVDTDGDATSVRVYVPESVIEDLDELEDETVTLILGKNNVVVAVIFEEETTEKDFLTAYDADKERITVGGTKYDLAEDVDADENGTDDGFGYTVELNGATYAGNYAGEVTPMAAALARISAIVTDVEDIEKKIQAEITLNDDDEVKFVELFLSATFDNTTETIVTEINKTTKKYEIQTTAGDIEWELEDEEDLEFPKVYTNGERTDIRDITVGNVLTIITGANKSDVEFGGNDIAKIFVGTETVTGDVTKVKKLNNAITMDGTVYLATEKNAVKMTTSEIEDDDFVTFNSTTILDNDEVTLYLNVLGEYVVASVTEDASEYQFGIITKVYESEGLEEIDGDEYAQRTIKVLLANGEEVRFTVQTNDDDKDTPSESDLDTLVDTTTGVGAFVMFVADSENVITLGEDSEELLLVSAYTGNDYEFDTIDLATAVSGKKFEMTGGATYAYTSNTVIFNSHASTGVGDEEIREVVSNWNSIINSTTNKFEATSGFAVVKEGTTKALYIVVNSTYSSSDYELAVVTRKLDEVKDGKYEIDFAHENDVEVDNNDDVIADLTNVKDWLIEYTTKNGKVNDAARLINLDAVADADSDTLIDGIFVDGTELTLAEKDSNPFFVAGSNFAQLEVSEIYIDGDDYADITFSKGENKVVVNEEAAFEANKANYFTTTDNTTYNSTSAADYDAEETYYEQKYTLVDQTKVTAPVAGTTYYTKAGTTYSPASLSGSWAASTEYYTMAYVVVDLTDIDMKLGTLELDAEELVVYDLRNGDVEKVTLTSTENPGFSAVVYKEASAAKPNVIFIID